MADRDWPVATPRDEMLARVAARGTRIRAVRGALNALAVMTVVGASTLGVGAALRAVSDSSPSTEVDNVAIGPEPPTLSVSGSSSNPSVTVSGGGSSSSTPGSAVGSTTSTSEPSGTAPGGSITSSTSGRTGTTSSSTSSSSTPGTSTTATSAPDTTVTSTSQAPTTTVPAPEVSNLRFKADGVYTGQSVCHEAEATVAVEITGADAAVLKWNRAGRTHRVEMVAEENLWSASIGELEDRATDVPVVITVEAMGPGGTTYESAIVEVADCSPLPSAPSESEA